MARLRQHRWPGNVRELENLVRRLSALYSEEVIDLETIETELADAILAPEPEPAANGRDASDVTLTDAVDRHLQALFAAHGDRLPPDGMYDRVISEVERPLLVAGAGGNAREPVARGPSPGAQSQHVAQEDQGPRRPGGAHAAGPPRRVT